MKIQSSAYDKKIYEINLNRNETMEEVNHIELEAYPSYIYKYRNNLTVALKMKVKK